jgi:hypothetical protein
MKTNLYYLTLVLTPFLFSSCVTPVYFTNDDDSAFVSEKNNIVASSSFTVDGIAAFNLNYSPIQNLSIGTNFVFCDGYFKNQYTLGSYYSTSNLHRFRVGGSYSFGFGKSSDKTDDNFPNTSSSQFTYQSKFLSHKFNFSVSYLSKYLGLSLNTNLVKTDIRKLIIYDLEPDQQSEIFRYENKWIPELYITFYFLTGFYISPYFSLNTTYVSNRYYNGGKLYMGLRFNIDQIIGKNE